MLDDVVRVSQKPDFFPSISFLNYLKNFSDEYLKVIGDFNFNSRSKCNFLFSDQKKELSSITLRALENYLVDELDQDFDKLFLFKKSIIDTFSVFLNQQFKLDEGLDCVKVDSWELEGVFKSNMFGKYLKNSKTISVYALNDLDPLVKSYFMRLSFKYNNVFFSKAGIPFLNNHLSKIIESENPQDRLSFLRDFNVINESDSSYSKNAFNSSDGVFGSSLLGVDRLKRRTPSRIRRKKHINHLSGSKSLKVNPGGAYGFSKDLVSSNPSVSSNHSASSNHSTYSNPSASSNPSDPSISSLVNKSGYATNAPSGVVVEETSFSKNSRTFMSNDSLSLLSDELKQKYVNRAKAFYTTNSYLFTNFDTSTPIVADRVLDFLKGHYRLDSSFEKFLKSPQGIIFLEQGSPLSEKKVSRIYDVRDSIIKHFNR